MQINSVQSNSQMSFGFLKIGPKCSADDLKLMHKEIRTGVQKAGDILCGAKDYHVILNSFKPQEAFEPLVITPSKKAWFGHFEFLNAIADPIHGDLNHLHIRTPRIDVNIRKLNNGSLEVCKGENTNEHFYRWDIPYVAEVANVLNKVSQEQKLKNNVIDPSRVLPLSDEVKIEKLLSPEEIVEKYRSV